MWHRGTVFVVQSDEIAGNHFAKDLRELRWRVHCFASVNALLERLSGQVTDAIVLRDRYDDPSLSIAAAPPRRALAWQDADACAQARIAAMDAGADACPAPDMSMAEWDALLRTLCRRLQGAGRPAPAWRVDMHARVLAGRRASGCRSPRPSAPSWCVCSMRRTTACDASVSCRATPPSSGTACAAWTCWSRVCAARRGGSISTCRYWRCGVGLHPAGAGRAGGRGRYRTTRLSRCMSSGSVMLPRMRAICDEGWRRMRRVSAAE